MGRRRCRKLESYRGIKHRDIAPDRALARPLKVDQPYMSGTVHNEVVLIEVTMCCTNICWTNQGNIRCSQQRIGKDALALQVLEVKILFSLHRFQLIRKYLFKFLWRVPE